jgi:hypothetical protein
MSEPAQTDRVLTIPNLISSLRIVLIPVFVLARCLSLVERSHNRHDGADCAAHNEAAERRQH